MNTFTPLLEAQRQYFGAGHTRSLAFRIAQLLKLKAAIESREADILAALQADLHKSEVEGYLSEIGLLLSEITYIVRHLKRWSRPRKVSTPPVYFGAKSRIVSEPLGVVLVMAPWNYPFQLLMSPLLGAMAAGNCAILKPSELAPQVSAVLAHLISETFDSRYIAVVEGGAEVSQGLLQQRFDHIFFTGGPGIGKLVMEAAAKHLTPVTLELGGKSPCLVDSNIALSYTARRIVWGKFLNAGQTCVAPDYLLVHREVKDALVAEMIKVLKEFYGEEPKACPHFGRIIGDRHHTRLVTLLEHQSILCGGQSDPATRYLAPTLVDAPALDSPLMQEEIFGPILPILTYENLNEALAFINARPKPLALYAFSRKQAFLDRVLAETSSGGVCLNDTILHITTTELPFGGVGNSGMGAYHGKASFDLFSHQRSVLQNTLLYDLRLKYPPYSLPLKWFKWMLRYLA